MTKRADLGDAIASPSIRIGSDGVAQQVDGGEIPHHAERGGTLSHHDERTVVETTTIVGSDGVAQVVRVVPLAEWARKVRRTLRPQHPPIFPDYWPPTREDAELALDLIRALDPESREWYATSEQRISEFLG